MKAMIDVLRCHSFFILQKCFQNTGKNILEMFSSFCHSKVTQTRLWRMCGSRPSLRMNQSLLRVKKMFCIILHQNLGLNVLNVNRFLAGGAAQWRSWPKLHSNLPGQKMAGHQLSRHVWLSLFSINHLIFCMTFTRYFVTSSYFF